MSDTTTLPDEIGDARLAYANACEAMGMAHANGTRAEWEAAVEVEERTRAVLVSAIYRALSDARAEVTRNAHAVEPESQTVGQLNTSVRVLREELHQQRIRAQNTEERGRRAREALRPFAGAARAMDRLSDMRGDDYTVFAFDGERVSTGDFRRARAVLAESDESEASHG